MFFVRLDRMAREDSVEECTEKFFRNTMEINDILKDIYLNGVILLQDDIVKTTIKNYDQLTISDRLNLPKVINMLSNITTREESVSHCYLLIDDKKVYTESGIYDMNLYFEEFHKYASLDLKSKILNETFDEDLSIMPVTLLNAGNKVKRVIPMVIRGVGKQILLIQDIEVLPIGNTLSAYSEDYQSFWITCNDEVIYQSTKGSRDLSYYLDNNQPKKEEYRLLSHDTAYNISLFSVIDYEKLNDHISEKYQNLSTLFIVFLILLSILIIILCLQLYNPVRQLKKVIIDEDIMKRQTGEFHNIETAIQNMRLDRRTTESKLNHVMNNFIKTQLELMVLYNKYPSTDMEEGALLSMLNFQKKEICCVAIEILESDTKNNPIFNFDDQQKCVLEDTLRYLLDSLLQKELNSYVISRSHLSYIAIIADEELTKDKIRTSMNKIADLFQYDYAYCKINIGVGLKIKSIKKVQESYFYAETMASLSGKDFRYQILFAEDQDLTYKVNTNKNKIEHIVNLIKSGDIEALKNKLNDSKLELSDKKVVAPEQRHFWHSVYRSILRIITEDSKSIFVINDIERKYFDYGCNGAMVRLSDYTDKVCNLCYDLCVCFDTKTLNIKQRINEIISYIHNNYAENIGLGEIAEEYDLSPHYLSRIFKECTNINISDYIAQYRIKTAQQLLLNSDEPIQDIAEKVGIISRATFLRLFKNITGISPTQYRKIYKGK